MDDLAIKSQNRKGSSSGLKSGIWFDEKTPT